MSQELDKYKCLETREFQLSLPSTTGNYNFTLTIPFTVYKIRLALSHCIDSSIAAGSELKPYIVNWKDLNLLIGLINYGQVYEPAGGFGKVVNNNRAFTFSEYYFDQGIRVNPGFTIELRDQTGVIPDVLVVDGKARLYLEFYGN